jgi:hypothetical protein
MGFNPMQSVVGFVVAMVGRGTWKYDPKEDLGGPVEAGRAAVRWETSTGTGRGSSKLVIPGDQAADIAEALAAFDPEAVEEEASFVDLPVADCIRRTIGVEETESGTRVVTFRTSVAKNARTIRVPASEWSGFVGVARDISGFVDDGVESYRTAVAESEKRAAAKAAKNPPAPEGAAPVDPPAAKKRGRKPKNAATETPPTE